MKKVEVEIADVRDLKLERGCFAELFKRVNETTMNKEFPYQPDASREFDGVMVHRRNNNGTQASRQATHVDTLLSLVKEKGSHEVKQQLKSLNESQLNHLILGTYLMRSGRFDEAGDNHRSRSAAIYEQYAQQLSKDQETIDWVKKLINNSSKPSKKRDPNIDAIPKNKVGHSLMTMAHQLDLRRCFSKEQFEGERKSMRSRLDYLLAPGEDKDSVLEVLENYGNKLCTATGAKLAVDRIPYDEPQYAKCSTEGDVCWNTVQSQKKPNWSSRPPLEAPSYHGPKKVSSPNSQASRTHASSQRRRTATAASRQASRTHASSQASSRAGRGVYTRIPFDPRQGTKKIEVEIADVRDLELNRDNFAELSKRINETTMNKPYPYQPQESKMLDGVMVHRPNHNGTQSVRQARHVESLLSLVKAQGSPEVKQQLKKLTESELNNLYLGAHLMRAGRFDEGRDDHRSRSAAIYEQYAQQMRQDQKTIDWVKKLITNACLPYNKRDRQIDAVPKNKIGHGLMTIAHQLDLVRCYSEDRFKEERQSIRARLDYFLAPGVDKDSILEALEGYGKRLCTATGSNLYIDGKHHYNNSLYAKCSTKGDFCWKTAQGQAIPNWSSF